jgi:hypothetical protein
LILPVPPENVSALIRLKIPRRNQNNVSHSDPHSSLQLASDSAQSFFAVLALHQDSVKPHHSDSYAQYIICRWQHHIFYLSFADDLPFAQSFTPGSLPLQEETHFKTLALLIQKTT